MASGSSWNLEIALSEGCCLLLSAHSFIIIISAAPDLQIRAQPRADLQIGVRTEHDPSLQLKRGGYGDLEIAWGSSSNLEIALS